MISHREIALWSNQLVFFLLQSLQRAFRVHNFSALIRVLRESFFTRYNLCILLARYWNLSLSVCTINPTYRNLFTTSSLWHFLLPVLLSARGALTTVYDFCKTKTHKLLPWSMRVLSSCAIKLSILYQ